MLFRSTDTAVKELFALCVGDIIAVQMGTEVREVRPLPTELVPSSAPLRADHVFAVTLVDGRDLVFHIEAQGRTSHRPMPDRMADYIHDMTPIYRGRLRLHLVLYLGNGAGRDDNGRHHILAADNSVLMAWNYRVIHLWQLSAEELLELGRPALLALIGQTRIDDPQTVLPQVVARLRTIPDPELQRRYLAITVALLPDEEMVTIMERLLETEDIVIDTPFLRRLRTQGRSEGLLEGEERGLIKGEERGLIKGEAIGQTKGTLRTLRHNILELLRSRFVIPQTAQQQLTTALDAITDQDTLQRLFTVAIHAQSIGAFQAALPPPTAAGNGHPPPSDAATN